MRTTHAERWSFISDLETTFFLYQLMIAKPGNEIQNKRSEIVISKELYPTIMSHNDYHSKFQMQEYDSQHDKKFIN